MFIDTTICIRYKIDKILISINNELIVIDDQGVIFNLGNFDFVHNFKLKKRYTDYSLKNIFEKVTYLEFGQNIEQYRNLLFSYDKKKLKCYNSQSRKLLRFKQLDDKNDESLEVNGSFAYNDSELIIKEGLKTRVFHFIAA